MARLFLGVDGGNTKTVGLAATPDGAVVGAGRAGCSDIYGAPSFESAIAELSAAVERTLAAAGAKPGDVASAVFSLAGADWPEDKRDLHEAAAALVPAARVAVVNDALGALRAGTDDGVGIAVVCGTGGCVGARGPAGEWHSSWWALKTGGWAIGADALDAVYAAELGIRPSTSLTERALRAFGFDTVEEVLHEFTRRGGRRSFDTAGFAPAVLEEAQRGDAVARALVAEHGARLGDVAGAAARIVGLEGTAYPLVLLGGVLRADGAGPLLDEILARVEGGEPVDAPLEPAAGALLLAFDAAGIALPRERLRETAPPAEVFETLG